MTDKEKAALEASWLAGNIFAQAGLEASLGFLYNEIRRYTPITRLQLSVYNKHSQKVYQLVTLGAFSGKVPGLVMKAEEFDANIAYQLYKMHDGDYSFEPHFVLNPKYKGTFFDPYFAHKANITMQLFTYNDEKILLNLFADQENVLFEEDVPFYFSLCYDLMEYFRNAVGGNFAYVTENSDSLKLLTQCPDLHDLCNKIEYIGAKNTTILIEGETGSGKDKVAEAIYSLSIKQNTPYVVINCGSLPESLIDSILFGYEKGAFTGATSVTKGVFEQADKGTLFLDEIGELPFLLQSRLLRVLDTHCIQRIGSSRQIPLDIRIIAATNRNLEAMVREGKFREDLYYRLKVFSLYMPPLRARKRDIPKLVLYFLQLKCKKLQISQIPIIPNKEMEKLVAHPWPGNVRQLEHYIEHALIVLQTGKNTSALFFSDLEKNDIVFQPKNNLNEDLTSALEIQSFSTLEQVIEEHIKKAILFSHGKLSGSHGADKLLGIHRTTLQRYLKSFQEEKKI